MRQLTMLFKKMYGFWSFNNVLCCNKNAEIKINGVRLIIWQASVDVCDNKKPSIIYEFCKASVRGVEWNAY